MAESTLQGLIGEIKEFLEWIKDTLEDDEARKALLEDVGLEPTDPPPKPNVPQDKLDSIGRYQQTVDADTQAGMLVVLVPVPDHVRLVHSPPLDLGWLLPIPVPGAQSNERNALWPANSPP